MLGYPGGMADRQAAEGGPGRLDGDLGWMLGVVFRSYVKASDHVLRDLPGGPRGYQIRTAADGEPPQNQGAMAGELGIDRTVLTYLIDDLERLNLVTRRPDPADRRSRLVVATDQDRATRRLAALEGKRECGHAHPRPLRAPNVTGHAE
jgi:DNA-binding MarR family transcriptional regulator